LMVTNTFPALGLLTACITSAGNLTIFSPE
jgi:hypothetical protein